jgi:benzodiazapine receptor
MFKDTLRQTANILAVIIAITVNILAVALPLNGQDSAEISDRFRVYFVPAGYVFSIWSLIYLGWIAFTIYQTLPAQKENPRLRRLGYLFAISCLFNGGWLFCWHYNFFGLSVLVMLTLVGLLIASYLALNVGGDRVSKVERWCIDSPFGVYLGWISVAAIANIADWLYLIQWNGFGLAPQAWAVIMLGVASLLGLLIAVTRRDAGYLLVFVWAFAGIAVKQSGESLVVNAAWAAAVFALGLAIFSLVRRRPIISINAQ